MHFWIVRLALIGIDELLEDRQVDCKSLAGPGVVGAGAIGSGMPTGDDIVCIQARAIVEDDAFAQMEGPYLAIVRYVPALSQARDNINPTK